MNDAIIKKHNFSTAKNQIQEFSRRLPANPRFEEVEEDGGLFGWFDHNVTGKEMNKFMGKVQDKLISVNSSLRGVIKEFGEIYKALDYLDNDYIIKENKYSSLKVDALKDEELTFKLDNANIKLQGYNVAIANTTAEFNYFIIPNKEGQTIIDFTLLSKETNEERHIKYQVIVNKDLAVSYEKIN